MTKLAQIIYTKWGYDIVVFHEDENPLFPTCPFFSLCTSFSVAFPNYSSLRISHFAYNTNMVITVRNEVAKVIFLQAGVCPHGEGSVCLNACWDTPPRADTPQGADTPPSHPGADTPLEQIHPRERRPLLRTVRILLECILVLKNYFFCKISIKNLKLLRQKQLTSVQIQQGFSRSQPQQDSAIGRSFLLELHI